jgi:hypothetical protein
MYRVLSGSTLLSVAVGELHLDARRPLRLRLPTDGRRLADRDARAVDLWTQCTRTILERGTSLADLTPDD